MRIIAVANQKGGCGKTVTAVNLAGAMAAMGRKTLLIDLDPQSHATSALGIKTTENSNSSYAIFEAFLHNNAVDINSLMHRKYLNLWIIGSHISLSTMEQKLAGVENAVLILNNTIKRDELSTFDYIIIDTPPSLGFLTLNAMHAANQAIIPLDVSLFSLNGLAQIEQILELSKSIGFEMPGLSFVITLFDARSNFAKSFLERAQKDFAGRLMQTVVRSNVKLREAAQAGAVVFEYNPSCNGARDYASLARELDPALKERPIHIAKEESPPKLHEPQTFFKLHAPEANSVYLVGNFNNWLADDNSLMKKLDNGTWIKIASLAEGRYSYKFVVDGRWIQDPANDATENDEFGGRNSVIFIKAMS